MFYVSPYVSTSPAATLDCFCRSHRQTQQCSHDFLLTFLPMVALMGILTISIAYTEMREVLRAVIHYSLSHRSLVDLYCRNRASHSAEVFYSTVRVIWKTFCASFTFAVPIKTLNILAFRRLRSPFEIKIYKHQQYFKAWMDCQILKWTLMENQEELADEKISFESLLNYFKSKEDGLEAFITCLESSLQNSSFFHLGHYSLHKLLAHETENILESDDCICNLKMQEIIKENICQFIELINVQELLPLMESKRLLTNQDKEKLNLKSDTHTDKADYLLTKLLPTKGHCGYNLFLECLEEEHSHSGHHEIAEKIKTELFKCQIRCPSKYSESLREIQTWYQPSLMNTPEYIEATETFMYLGQSSDVQKVYNAIEAFILSHSATPEAKAFGFMMKILCLKYRCKDSKLRNLICQTNQCINRIENDDNKRDIKGHWNLILSCWYRHQGNFQKARVYLDQAKPELIFGNNRAHVLYHEASLLIENTTSSHSSATKEDKRIIILLEGAIRGFHSKSNIMRARCFLQVAHCCIGSSLTSPCILQRSVDLDKADSILNMLAQQLNFLPLRLQMHYYTVMCDYHRVHSRKQEAIDCINKGLTLDTSNQFKRDQKYLQHRMN